MSSINPHFTFTYVQPEEYRFSHDSVFMARRVFDFLCDVNLSQWRILDLCAGCGIVGLDFLFHVQTAGRPMPAACDFLDVQDVYAPFFRENAKNIRGTELCFLNKNYSALIPGTDSYDLVLCNPPFFRAGQGDLSPSEFKNRCRFFMDSDFPTLLRAITCALKPGSSRGYLLLRDLSDHGLDVEAEAQALLEPAISKVGEIRGTALMEITRLSLRTNVRF